MSLLDRRDADRRTASASAQDVLTAVGETLYEWDIAADRIRWGGNAGAVLGIGDAGVLATSQSYDALVHPDSFTNRRQAVLNGIGVDYGAGVRFDVTYALRLPSDSGARTVWVQDSGVWFADAEGAPYLARGVVRLCRTPATRSAAAPAANRDLPRRGAFLRLLNSVLAMTAHYRTHHAFVALAIDNMALATRCFGLAVAEELDAAVGDRVRGAVRSGDIAGWLGDCEIGLLLCVGDRGEAEQAVERIVRAIGEPAIATSAGPVTPLVTAGVVIAPFQASTLEQCLSRAHAAQERARSRRAGRVHFFDEEADAKAVPDWETAQALQALLGKGGALLCRPAAGARIQAAARALGAEIVVEAGEGSAALGSPSVDLVELGPESAVVLQPGATAGPRQRSRKSA